MCSNKLKIDIKALSEGESSVSFDLTDDYFMSNGSEEIAQGDMHVAVSIRKTPHFSEVYYHAAGIVKIQCDRCLDLMDQSIDCEQRLTVKLGDEYSEEDDLITLDENNAVLDLSWFIYETIVLSLPVKHVHAPGKCNPAMINMLNEHSATRSDDTEETKVIDPRWSKLMNLNIEN